MPPTRKAISCAVSVAAVALLADDLGCQHVEYPPRIVDEPHEVARRHFGVAQRLLVRELLAAHALGEVGDRRDRGDAQPGVTGEDHLGNRRHPDRVRAERAERADLGRGLERGAGGGEVDAFGEGTRARPRRPAAWRAARGRRRRAGWGSAGRSPRRWAP